MKGMKAWAIGLGFIPAQESWLITRLNETLP
jgi:hypothetical protein